MLPIIVVVATQVAAQALIKRAKDNPEEVSLRSPPPPTPPTWKDRMADIAFWFITLLPGLLIATCAGMACYIILKIAFAKQGVSFP